MGGSGHPGRSYRAGMDDPSALGSGVRGPDFPVAAGADDRRIGPSASADDGRHHAHEALAPHWSFTVTLIVLAVAFGWHATNTVAYIAEVLVALSAVAASPLLVAFTPSVRHRRRTDPRTPHRHRGRGERLSVALLVLSAVGLVLVATAGLSTWVTAAMLGGVVALLLVTLYYDRAVPVEAEHVAGWSARLSHALHSPAFAGLLLFLGMMTSVTLAWW